MRERERGAVKEIRGIMPRERREEVGWGGSGCMKWERGDRERLECDML